MRLSVAMVRSHPARFVGSFVALALGVAVMSANISLWASSQPSVPAEYVDAGVLVHSPVGGEDDDSFPEYRPWSAGELATLLPRLAAIPGVTAAVADRPFYAQPVVTGRPVENVHTGRSWAVSGLSGVRVTRGAPPSADGEVAVGAALGVAPGERLTVLTGAGPVEWTVTGVLDGPGVYVADVAAERLGGGAKVIGLRLAAGTPPSRVAAAASGAVGELGTVLHGDARRDLEPEETTRTRWLGAQLIIAMVGLAGFVTVFVAASTFAFAATQRRREIGLLRTLGATPRQIRRLLLGEALVVAAAAGLVGVVVGAVVAPQLAGPFVSAGLEPDGFTVRVVPWALAVSFGAGLVVAVLGAWSVARRAGRTAPLEALRVSVVERRPMTVLRWVFGLGSTAGGVTLVAAVPGAPADQMVDLAMYGAMALTVGTALLAPVIVVPLVRIATWRSTPVSLLVREGALVAVRRVASTAAPVLVTVGFATLLIGSAQLFTTDAVARDAAEVGEVAVVVPHRAPGLSDAAVRAVGGTPEPATTVFVDGRAVSAVGTASGSPAGAPAGSPAGGRRAEVRFADGAVVTVVVDGSVPLRLPFELVRAHDPSALTRHAVLPSTVELGRLDGLGAEVVDAYGYAQRLDAEEDRLVRLFLSVLLAMSVGYALVAVANTLLMATAGRVPDLVALRLAGATPTQAVRAAGAEAAIAVGVGALLGVAVAATALVGVRSGLVAQSGTDIRYALPWITILSVSALCMAVAVVCAAVPVWRIVRHHALTGI